MLPRVGGGIVSHRSKEPGWPAEKKERGGGLTTQRNLKLHGGFLLRELPKHLQGERWRSGCDVTPKSQADHQGSFGGGEATLAHSSWYKFGGGGGREGKGRKGMQGGPGDWKSLLQGVEEAGGGQITAPAGQLQRRARGWQSEQPALLQSSLARGSLARSLPPNPHDDSLALSPPRAASSGPRWQQTRRRGGKFARGPHRPFAKKGRRGEGRGAAGGGEETRSRPSNSGSPSVEQVQARKNSCGGRRSWRGRAGPSQPSEGLARLL